MAMSEFFESHGEENVKLRLCRLCFSGVFLMEIKVCVDRNTYRTETWEWYIPCLCIGPSMGGLYLGSVFIKCVSVLFYWQNGSEERNPGSFCASCPGIRSTF